MSKISNTSALSKISSARATAPVPVLVTKSNLPSQNKVSNQLLNLVDNRTSDKENGNIKIDIGIIPLPNTTKLMANYVCK